MVERDLAKVEVAGSSPVIRSKKQKSKSNDLLFCFLEQLNSSYDELNSLWELNCLRQLNALRALKENLI